MNVFEDLVDALKQENLIEQTVIETKKVNTDDEYLGTVMVESKFSKDNAFSSENQAETNEADGIENVSGSADSIEANGFELSEKEISGAAEMNNQSQPASSNEKLNNSPLSLQRENKNPIDEKEFYRKRAMDEVSGLQMVEHVLSGVEREQMKTMPKLYNDIAAKKALHDFMRVVGDVKSSEHAQAEFQLMQETETWCSALSHRDKRVSVAHLRRYCETTRPALSSQALISLARFYRNLPFSESVRSKFDLIVTKLFTKDAGEEKRMLVFERDELIEHLKDLYADWSSIPLYSTDSDDSGIVLAAIKFEDFMMEAENVGSFDELIKNDFFNRLRLFKESSNELFYAPLVTATAIECNVRIGNKYIDLIRSEREKSSIGDLQEKYGFLHDQTISDATSKTFQLIDLLKGQTEVPAPVRKQKPMTEFMPSPASASADAKSPDSPQKKTISKPEKTKNSLFAVNKWLLAATLVAVMLSLGIHFWVNLTAPPVSNANVKKVNLENSWLKEHLQTARINSDTFYGVTLPSWDLMATEKKEEVLKKILQFGNDASIDKKFVKVALVDKQGRAVGFATVQKVEVINP